MAWVGYRSDFNSTLLSARVVHSTRVNWINTWAFASNCVYQRAIGRDLNCNVLVFLFQRDISVRFMFYFVIFLYSCIYDVLFCDPVLSCIYDVLFCDTVYICVYDVLFCVFIYSFIYDVLFYDPVFSCIYEVLFCVFIYSRIYGVLFCDPLYSFICDVLFCDPLFSFICDVYFVIKFTVLLCYSLVYYVWMIISIWLRNKILLYGIVIYFIFFPVNMPLVSSIGPVLVRCWQHWPSTGPVLAYNGMFMELFCVVLCNFRLSYSCRHNKNIIKTLMTILAKIVVCFIYCIVLYFIEFLCNCNVFDCIVRCWKYAVLEICCVYICIGICIDICIAICIDICIDICIGICICTVLYCVVLHCIGLHCFLISDRLSRKTT